MNIKHIVTANIFAHLPDGFQKRLAFNVADGAADFNQHHIGAGLFGQLVEAGFDLTGQVWHNLDSAAQIIAAALFGDNGGIDLAGGDVRFGREVNVNEPLVIAEVKISFGTVTGDKDLTMLVRRHGARIYV